MDCPRAPLLVVLAALGCAEPPPSAEPPPDIAAVIDPIVAPRIGADALGELDRCPAAVVAVVTPAGTAVRGYGAMVAGGTQAPDPDTLFQIGSISKVYTGLVLARLVADGQLAIDGVALDAGGADLRAAMPGATFSLADLVTHRAGFPTMPANLIDRDGDGAPDPGADPLSPGRGYSRADLRAGITGLPLDTAGSFRYSNLGLGLLAVIVQDHLGLASFDAVLAAQLAPLGATSTWGNVAAIPADAQARVVQGYALRAGQRVAGHPAEMGVLAGAGEVMTSGRDAARVLAALAGQAPGPLDPAIALAIAPLAPSGMAGVDMGYALEVRHEASGDRYTKAGETPSFTAQLSFHRSPPVGAYVMTACGGFTGARELALAIDDALVAWVAAGGAR